MRESNKNEIKSMDTPNLTKLRNIVRDKWTWDTGTDEDKEYLDFIETELDSRDINESSDYYDIATSCLQIDGNEIFKRRTSYGTTDWELGEEMVKAVRAAIVESIGTHATYDSYDCDVGDAVSSNILREINGKLDTALETKINLLISNEVNVLECRMRDEIDMRIDTLKLEIDQRLSNMKLG